ncbi:MAG TPA: CHAT domain-containing protein [Candidatus Eisenbacteria bacterium]|nr:CHAT domain-containing protein [Candidatus Eisenbacteria bacterium]
MKFDALPGTGKEINELIDRWKRASSDKSSAPAAALDLRDSAATETALRSHAAGRRVLHLATHGFFLGGGVCDPGGPSTRGIGGLAPTVDVKTGSPPLQFSGENPLLLSGLVMAGANHRSAAAEGEDDGILTAEEIGSLDLTSVEWAVLSACETGVGDVRAGEGVFGLRRAFQVAGAGSLIMSLWSVDDEATRVWMNALYKARLDRKRDTAESVREASLEILRHRRKVGTSSHPFYWGAFVAAGDWR